MQRRLVFIVAAVCVLAFAGSSLAGKPAGTQVIISYDGYLERQPNPDPPPGFLFSADTLIVVTNSHPSKGMYAFIEVFDKYGVSFGDPVAFLNGGAQWPGGLIPANAYGWMILALMVTRDTQDPWGEVGAEKFSFRIYTTKAGNLIPPVVEVKQVIYHTPVESPTESIWRPQDISLWTETALGGLNGPGIVWEAP